MALKPKHQTFLNAYLRHFNATKAAIEAGYSEKSARQTGSEILAYPYIQDALRAHMEADAMDTREVLYHLAQIARGDLDDLVDEHGNIDLAKARALGKTNLIKKIRQRTVTSTDKDGEGTDIFETETEQYDRIRALELIGKATRLFVDKSEVNNSGEITVRYVDHWRDDNPPDTS